MQYYWVMLNRTFEVFVTDTKLCAARVGGQVASPIFVDERLKDPQFYVRPRLLSRYDGIDPESLEFLKIDRANFQILREEICGIEHHRTKWGMGAVPYSGRVLISLHDGTKREFVLVGMQDSRSIVKRLQESPSNTSLERTSEG
jgi:hypothetical protein